MTARQAFRTFYRAARLAQRGPMCFYIGQQLFLGTLARAIGELPMPVIERCERVAAHLADARLAPTEQAA